MADLPKASCLNIADVTSVTLICILTTRISDVWQHENMMDVTRYCDTPSSSFCGCPPPDPSPSWVPSLMSSDHLTRGCPVVSGGVGPRHSRAR